MNANVDRNCAPRSVQRGMLWIALLLLGVTLAAQTWRCGRNGRHSVDSAVRQAVEDGAAADLRAALNAGGSVDARDGRGQWTPLMRAAAAGNIECCNLLISRGADVNAMTAFDWTPLMLAALTREKDAVRLLINSGADVNYATPQGITALMAAAREGEWEICQDLLKAGAHADAADSSGRTLLHLAADCGDQTRGALTLRGLLSHGLDVNARDETGQTPLMEAAIAGNLAVADELLRRGAAIDTRNHAGETALDLAVQNQNDHITDLLQQRIDAATATARK